MVTKEHRRLAEDKISGEWKKWGPYLSERQWATVREDYTEDGNVWGSIVHEHARSKAYRWGEDGIGGFCNEDQRICFAWAFWNGKDPILKERLYGLTGHEGNHGEDVKEIYYYLDSTPTHSYMKMLYKYPQQEYPYQQLVEENTKRGKLEREYELIDTGLFDDNQYFDIFMEYAKHTTEDFLMVADIHNRYEKAAELYVLPTLWFRNTWSSGRDRNVPQITKESEYTLKINHHLLGEFYLYFEDEVQELVFCDNETNRQKLYHSDNHSAYPKDGINDYLIEGAKSINPKNRGTKSSGIYKLNVQGGSSKKIRIRFSKEKLEQPFNDFYSIFELRKGECDDFYESVQRKVPAGELRNIQRQAFAGLMWSKQFYYYNVRKWLQGDPGRLPPPESRKRGRNSDWQHLMNYDVISMPDKWEYPWYAAWDLAFHTIPIARIDPEFAKEQLL
jgi:hypothetical protein